MLAINGKIWYNRKKEWYIGFVLVGIGNILSELRNEHIAKMTQQHPAIGDATSPMPETNPLSAPTGVKK